MSQCAPPELALGRILATLGAAPDPEAGAVLARHLMRRDVVLLSEPAPGPWQVVPAAGSGERHPDAPELLYSPAWAGGVGCLSPVAARALGAEAAEGGGHRLPRPACADQVEQLLGDRWSITALCTLLNRRLHQDRESVYPAEVSAAEGAAFASASIEQGPDWVRGYLGRRPVRLSLETTFLYDSRAAAGCWRDPDEGGSSPGPARMFELAADVRAAGGQVVDARGADHPDGAGFQAVLRVEEAIRWLAVAVVREERRFVRSRVVRELATALLFAGYDETVATAAGVLVDWWCEADARGLLGSPPLLERPGGA